MLKALRILGRRTSLEIPQGVRDLIMTHSGWSDAFKRNLSEAYRHYAEWNGLFWQKLFFKPVDKLPFIPTEQELDSLISSVGWKTSAVLQLLKETE